MCVKKKKKKIDDDDDYSSDDEPKYIRPPERSNSFMIPFTFNRMGRQLPFSASQECLMEDTEFAIKVKFNFYLFRFCKIFSSILAVAIAVAVAVFFFMIIFHHKHTYIYIYTATTTPLRSITIICLYPWGHFYGKSLNRYLGIGHVIYLA